MEDLNIKKLSVLPNLIYNYHDLSKKYQHDCIFFAYFLETSYTYSE